MPHPLAHRYWLAVARRLGLPGAVELAYADALSPANAHLLASMWHTGASQCCWELLQVEYVEYKQERIKKKLSRFPRLESSLSVLSYSVVAVAYHRYRFSASQKEQCPNGRL